MFTWFKRLYENVILSTNVTTEITSEILLNFHAISSWQLILLLFATYTRWYCLDVDALSQMRSVQENINNIESWIMKNFEQLDVITALSEMPNKNDKMKEKF